MSGTSPSASLPAGGPDPGPAAAPIGRVGPYVLVRELGRGAMSAVYEARREGLSRAFALKLLLDHQRDPEALRRFELEARIMSKLHHPGIVPVVDAGQDGAHRYLVMELVRGPSLAQELARRGRLPAREAAELLRQISAAVEAAHREGVVHRDLKPANVLLDERTGRPRVADFGLARAPDLAASMTRSGDTVGTPLYMAPEQFAGARCDARADVWALGVILYEALCGRRPFEGANYLLVARAVRKARLVPPRAVDPAIPPELEAICLRALERELSRRTPSAGVLAGELAGFLAGAGSASQPGPGAGQADARQGRRAALPRGALLAALLLAAGAGMAGALVAARWAGRRPLAPAPRPEGSSALPPPAPPERPAPPDPASLLEEARARAAGRAGLQEVLALVERAREAAAEDPAQRAWVDVERADLYSRRGRWEDSIAAAEAVIAAAPGTRPALEARLVRAFALIRAERSPEGFQALDDLYRDDPAGPVGMTARASRQIFEGHPQALELTAQALALEPGYAQAEITRAHALLNAGRHPEAAELLLRARARRSDDPRLHYYLGRVRLDQRDFAGALEAYDETVRLVEPHPWRLLLQYRVNCLTALGRLPEAIAGLDRLLVMEPRDLQVTFLRGLLRAQTGDAQGAASDWRRARELDPVGFEQAMGQLQDPRLREAVRQALGE